MKVEILRKKYPRFVFESFDFRVKKKGLEIFFNFKIEPDIKFHPKILIEGIKKKEVKRVGERKLENLIFNLGMVEILSYWKATCSPKIEILAEKLNKEQIKFWKNLILRGMGQFFFEHNIDFRKNFFTIKASNNFYDSRNCLIRKLNEEKFLVPVGGGKDSVVTIEYLKKFGKKLILFSLNPQESHKKIIKLSKVKEKIFVKREIDKKLLELNKKGFLNGHTPFCAYLSFLAVLIASLKDCKFVVFSNEKSSEEGNLKYLGRIINHQYSKSKDFEEKFRKYSKKYLARDIECFSLLRNLYEIEIAKLFSQFPQYFNAFLSCNEAFKTYSGKKKPLKRWCGKCPKCLFVFASLYPFIGEKVIKIFKKNLFEDKKLLPLMYRLIGKEKFKPFECVGTKKESFLAFKMSLERWEKENKGKLPFLLSKFKTFLSHFKNLSKSLKIL
jgi:7-cyano-7-deazaguanine synthase in queuosine biosynthesis